MIRKYIKDLKSEFHGYSAKSFSNDLMAGLTVAAVALPLALAFGVSSGATAASGLMTAIIAGCIISIFGGAFYQISGPTGAMAAILMAVVANYGLEGVFLATAFAGVLLILAGVFRIGKLTAFIPMPVITGFTSGIAVIIACGQIDNFFGVTSQGTSLVEKLMSYGTLGFNPNWIAVLIGLGVVILMIVYPKKWNAVVPASLVGIIIATAVAIVFDLQVASVGEIPKSLMLPERLTLSSIELSKIKGIISPAISIAALGMVESLLCGASAGRMTRVRLDANRELIAQGIGNLVVPFFGGVPATAAIARTSVAVKSGARTRLTGVIHAISLLIFMLVLGPIMSRIPLSALAGVLMVTAWRMNEWSAIKYMFSKKFKGAIFKFFVTMIATILLDLTVAIVIGVICGFVLLTIRVLKRNAKHADKAPLISKLAITVTPDGEKVRVEFTGAVIFSNTGVIEEVIHHALGQKELVISLAGVKDMDISGAQTLLENIEQIKESGCDVRITDTPECIVFNVMRSGLSEFELQNA